jgi:hypothetical protein
VLASYAGRAAGTNTSSATVFRCPADHLGYFAREGSSYEWNVGLNGHHIDETRTQNQFMIREDANGAPIFSTNWTMVFPPQTTPLLLDYEEFHPRPPKSGKNVVYMDNHVAPLAVWSGAPSDPLPGPPAAPAQIVK